MTFLSSESVDVYLLYIDESGISGNQAHLVLAGISTFERQTWWLSSELDKIAARFDPANPSEIELHGSPMWAGRGMWRAHPKAKRIQAIKDALDVAAQSHISNRVFASVVRKAAHTTGTGDPVEFAFEHLANRFDRYLMRLYRQRDEPARGIMVFDKATYESTLQSLATDFRTIGHRWGVLRNFAEVPLFLDSRASRLIQLADLIAYGIYRKFERSDAVLFDIIAPRFDADMGVQHGLHTHV